VGICIGYEFFVTTWDESCVESQELTQLPPYADNVANSDFESLSKHRTARHLQIPRGSCNLVSHSVLKKDEARFKETDWRDG
jgi:hypothetical protein